MWATSLLYPREMPWCCHGSVQEGCLNMQTHLHRKMLEVSQCKQPVGIEMYFPRSRSQQMRDLQGVHLKYPMKESALKVCHIQEAMMLENVNNDVRKCSVVWACALINHQSWNGQACWVFKKNPLKLNADYHNFASWFTDTDGFLEHSPSGGSLYYNGWSCGG